MGMAGTIQFNRGAAWSQAAAQIESSNIPRSFFLRATPPYLILSCLGQCASPRVVASCSSSMQKYGMLFWIHRQSINLVYALCIVWAWVTILLVPVVRLGQLHQTISWFDIHVISPNLSSLYRNKDEKSWPSWFLHSFVLNRTRPSSISTCPISPNSIKTLHLKCSVKTI